MDSFQSASNRGTGCTPLLCAAHAGREKEAASLLEAGASAGGSQELFEWWVARYGPGPDRGASALLRAVCGSAELSQRPLDLGAPLGAAEPFARRTALILAALHGPAELAALLIARGADVDARDRPVRTALTYALAAGRRRTVELLCAARGR